MRFLSVLCAALLLPVVNAGAAAEGAFVPSALRTSPNLVDNIDRPLRYQPDGDDFVIANGSEFFNRPLYGGNTAFRSDAGDRPEFTLYLPGRGGNLRVGIKSAAGSKWLFDAERVVARYRPGSMIYEISDPLLGDGKLVLTAIAMNATEGLIVRAEANGISEGVELTWAFGGANGQRGARDGDIGTERVAISQYFQLKPEFCEGNSYVVEGATFTLSSKPASIRGTGPAGATLSIADAAKWASFDDLLASSAAEAPKLPVVIGRAPLVSGQPLHLALQRLPAANTAAEELSTYQNVTTARAGVDRSATPVSLLPAYSSDDLPRVFAETEAHFRLLRDRVRVETPDPFINAAVSALNVGIDAVWDEPQGAVMHGAIAWRAKLLGWRGPYATDAFGWHDRARRNIRYWAGRQNTDPIPEKLPPPDENANLARSEAALHSNGDLSNSHYDMNMVFIDGVFRHLLWTGDIEFARELWPMIERHLAWERRLFRREFGPEKLPLYEAYATLWASDDLQYHGGGVTHSSAYNYFHHQMAAKIARLIGADAQPYETEAELILKGMRQQLWLVDRGWYAEFKDLLGNQLVHPSAAVWSFYHTIDSHAMNPFEAWQMTRYIDTLIPHIPVRGPGVPDDQPYAMLSTTNWMPYAWSINNVVMGETVHTALGYWQARRAEEAYRLTKSALLSAMYVGICPGNVGTMSYLDVYRREAQRDFADGGGVLSRALVEGLFGVQPDVLAGTLNVAPGFPAEWDHARLRHSDMDVSFQRKGTSDTYHIEPRFQKPLALRLELAASHEGVEAVRVNGQQVEWELIEEAIGQPRIAIRSKAAATHDVAVTWKATPVAATSLRYTVEQGAEITVSLPADVIGWSDPQNAFTGVEPVTAAGGSTANAAGHAWRFKAVGTTGERTLFAHLRNAGLTWWQPVDIRITEKSLAASATRDGSEPGRGERRFETVDLSATFNESVTQIFKNEYRSPRSPYVSLALPKQGIGAWAGGVNHTAEIDDAGFRAAAKANGGRIMLPSGIPFATPPDSGARNIVFTSQWDNYPRDARVSLNGTARRVHLLMAGSTNWMQSRFDNGEVVVKYTDGTYSRLALNNPVNWWPIDQDYFIDDFQFRRPEPIPPRINLKTGEIRMPDIATFKGGASRSLPGGAATALELPLESGKTLQSLTVRTIANEVVIGLMAVTLER